MIEACSVTKVYRGRTVVDGVSARFEPGLVHALVGPNGAGKSTLLSLAAGLLTPDAGEMKIDGRSTSAWGRQSLARRLSMLLQNQRTDLRLTVSELVSLGRFPHAGHRLGPSDHRSVEAALEFMGLETLRHALVPELSGGERQRAYLAMTLAQDTEAVLLDEPLNNLDPAQAVRMLGLIRRLSRDLKKTVLVVLHDLGAAGQCDRVWALGAGRLVRTGAPDEVLEPGLLHALYGVPFRIDRLGNRLLCTPVEEARDAG